MAAARTTRGRHISPASAVTGAAADPIPAAVLALHRDLAAVTARVPMVQVPPAFMALHRDLAAVMARVPVVQVPPEFLAPACAIAQALAALAASGIIVR